MYYGLGTVDRIASGQLADAAAYVSVGAGQMSRVLSPDGSTFCVNDVMATILKVLHHIGSLTPSVDAYLFEVPQITVVHLKLALYKFHYLLTIVQNFFANRFE